jgi:sugar lactone lactonase YvrE
MKRLTIGALAIFALLAPSAEAKHKDRFPATIALPPEWRPEGIASGRGTDFYVGSIPQGAVWKGDYRTGRGAVLVPPHEGRNHTGLKYDKRGKRLFVAGGASKGIYVYDAKTGADVRAYSISTAGFINDVTITRDGAYFTDSQMQVLYKVPIARDGSLGALETIEISGDLVYTAGFNANGIAATRDGKTLVIVKSNDGRLFTADTAGVTKEIALDQPVTNGDGILLQGKTVWVVRNQLNQVVEVQLNRSLSTGRTGQVLTDPRLDIPTTIAPFGKSLYAVNARFNRPDESDDDIVRLEPRRGHGHKRGHHRHRHRR